MAVLAPMPNASVATATRLNPGLCRMARQARRKSLEMSIKSLYAQPADGVCKIPRSVGRHRRRGGPAALTVGLAQESCLDPLFNGCGLVLALHLAQNAGIDAQGRVHHLVRL